MHTRKRIAFLPRSTRGVLLLLILIILLPALIEQWHIYSNWLTQERKAEIERNTEFARAISMNIEGFIRDVSRQESAIGRALLSRASLDSQWASRFLAASAAEYPAIDRFNWIDLSGIIVASSAPEAIGTNVSDRVYFRQQIAGRETASISDLLISRVTKNPTFYIARAIYHKGRLQGVMMAAVDPRKLGILALRIERPSLGAFSLVDHAGWCLYNSANPSIKWDERNWLPQYRQFARALGGEEWTGIGPWVTGSGKQVVAIVPMSSTGWAVSASRPESVVMQPILQKLSRSILWNSLLVLFSIIAALFILRYVVQPIKRLASDTEAFGHGDLDRRTQVFGPVELQRLAESFNDMAEQLQAQQEELTAQNEELQAQQEELSAQNEELQAQQEELTAQSEELQAHQQEMVEKATTLERLTEALETGRAFLSAGIEILPLPMLFITADSQVMLANEACCSMLGRHDVQEWWAQHELLTPDTHIVIPETRHPFACALRGEVTVSMEALVVLPDGQERPTLIQAAPVVVGDETVAVVEIIQDISTLKEEDRAKNEFLAVLSHELLTPVTSMLGWAQVAQDDTATPAIIEQALVVIERNARRQKRLVDDLLDVSRIIHGKFVLNPEPIDFSQLVAQQVENVQQQANSSEIALTFQAASHPLIVNADQTRTTQAVANLLNNALKFTKTGGTVSLKCDRTDRYAVLTVSDTGRGLPLEDIGDIFNPFHQLHRNETAGGLGLGLALVKGIVELQGGHVSAYSPGIGHGSEFTVELPLFQDFSQQG